MITRLRIDNFKSLKGIDVRLGPINFIVGPNASGKSNLAEAIDFISHAVREDLAYAVAEKGRFYNICHRRQRRARGAISFAVDASIQRRHDVCDFSLSFQLKTKGEDIRADFFVASEELTLALRPKDPQSCDGVRLHIWRNENKYEVDFAREVSPNPNAKLTQSQQNFERKFGNLKEFLSDSIEPDPQQLFISGFLKQFWPVSMAGQELQGLRVFQLNPRLARQPAAPSVHGDLGRRGENLASALDRMRLHEERNFKTLCSWLRDVVPTVGSLLTNYTETRQLGLFFEEEGFGSRWFAEDVSDGTIMCVALFFALLDRRHRIIVIEEPETSLHPWILRKFLERCREQSERCQILITTHSPLAIAQALPSELFLIERIDGITTLLPAMEVESALPEIIRKDLIDLGQYWLSGGLGAVPRVPETKQDELFGNSEAS
jgi:predicted ATPase